MEEIIDPAATTRFPPLAVSPAPTETLTVPAAPPVAAPLVNDIAPEALALEVMMGWHVDNLSLPFVAIREG